MNTFIKFSSATSLYVQVCIQLLHVSGTSVLLSKIHVYDKNFKHTFLLWLTKAFGGANVVVEMSKLDIQMFFP